jgi:hypothetical protein
MNHHDYNTEYRYVLTNKDCERIERLIMLLGDTIYELFKARELVGNLIIDESPSTEECNFHEELHHLKNSMIDPN